MHKHTWLADLQPFDLLLFRAQDWFDATHKFEAELATRPCPCLSTSIFAQAARQKEIAYKLCIAQELLKHKRRGKADTYPMPASKCAFCKAFVAAHEEGGKAFVAANKGKVKRKM